jgi:hypothetical protein
MSIQYDKDGVTLFYIDANGQRVAAGYTDTERYSGLLLIMGEQKQAGLDNAQAVTKYNAALGAIQSEIDTGRAGLNPDIPTQPPPKPLQKIVSDTGVVSYVPFVPPLADLVIPKTTPSTGLIAAVVPDKQAIMFNMISAMFRKEFPDA